MTDLQRALAHLDGYRVSRGRYAYVASDEGASIEYTLDSDDWRDLGRRLRTDEPDAYSLWCAATTPTRRRVNEGGDETAHGYTFAEWLTAAGRSDSASEYDLRAAWRAGEDPSEYALGGES
jgi:hypothetical protein